jgi:hypothetical protein
MGYLYIGDTLYGDDPEAPRPWLMPRAPATAQAHDEVALMRDAARKVVRHQAKRRARAYLAEPRQLNALVPGLCGASSRELFLAAATMFDREVAVPRRHIGFGGEVPGINFLALRLLARLMRRREARARKAA